MSNKKKNKKRKNSNNQNKNYAKKKDTDEKIVKNEEEKKIEEKVEIKEDDKEEVEIKKENNENKEVKNSTEEKENKKKDNKEFNRRFWIDVILLLLIFCVIGVLFSQIMNNSIEKASNDEVMKTDDYEIKNSTLDMSIEEYIDSLKENKLNSSIFSNLENKDINENGKDENIFYYQGLLGENNAVGIATKNENDRFLSIDFLSRSTSEEYKEDFKKIIRYTLLSSGIEAKDVETIISKFEAREKLDKSFNNVRVFMDFSSKDFFVTKIIYNRRLATRLKNVYSQEVYDLVGDVD